MIHWAKWREIERIWKFQCQGDNWGVFQNIENFPFSSCQATHIHSPTYLNLLRAIKDVRHTVLLLFKKYNWEWIYRYKLEFLIQRIRKAFQNWFEKRNFRANWKVPSVIGKQDEDQFLIHSRNVHQKNYKLHINVISCTGVWVASLNNITGLLYKPPTVEHSTELFLDSLWKLIPSMFNAGRYAFVSSFWFQKAQLFSFISGCFLELVKHHHPLSLIQYLSNLNVWKPK